MRRRIKVTETVDAKKIRIGKAEAIRIAQSVREISVARGNKLITVFVAGTSQRELAKLLLGPSGNLRAPTARVGKKLYVGFSESFYTAS